MPVGAVWRLGPDHADGVSVVDAYPRTSVPGRRREQVQAGTGSRRTRTAVMLRPGDDQCEVLPASGTALVEYAAPFRPRAKSLTFGHLVAVTTTPDGSAFIIWRWFDAVVVQQSLSRSVFGNPHTARCWRHRAMRRTGIRWEPGRTCLPVCPALSGGSRGPSAPSEAPM